MALLANFAPARAAGADEEIRKAEKSWASAVAAANYAAIEKILSDSLIYAHSTGIVESKGEYMSKLKSGAQKYTGIEHESITVRAFGDTAVAHSNVRMTGSTKGQPFDNKLMMMHVWVKQGGNWQLAAHQTTRLP